MKSLLTFLLNRVISILPLIKPFSIRKEFNRHTKHEVPISDHTEPFDVCKHGLEVYDLQSQEVF